MCSSRGDKLVDSIIRDRKRWLKQFRSITWKGVEVEAGDTREVSGAACGQGCCLPRRSHPVCAAAGLDAQHCRAQPS